MRAAIIVNGVVQNVVELDSLSQIPGTVACTACSIGDLYDGAVFTPPPKPLAEVKAAKLAELKAAWDATQNLGIQTRGHTFLTGGKARERLDRLLAAQANGITIPDTIRADDGTPVDFTAVTIKALYDAVIKAERQAEDKYWTKRAQVNAATTPEQVAVVEW